MESNRPNNLKLKFDRFKREKKDQLKKVAIGVGIGAAVTFVVVTRNIREEQEELSRDQEVLFDNQMEMVRIMEKHDLINNITFKN